MKTLSLLLPSILYASITTLGANPGLPRISATYPPPEDVRSPDRLIPGAHKGPVTVLAYGFNGRVLATAGGDNVIRVWDSRTGEQGTGELIRTFAGHSGRVLGVCFGSDTNRLFSVSEDQTMKAWEYSSGRLVRSAAVKIIGEHSGAAFRSGEVPILAVLAGNELSLWNYDTGDLANRFSPHDARVLSAVAFSPDGNVLVTATMQGAVGIWDAASGQLLDGITSLSESGVRSLAVGAEYVAAGCGDGSVHLWSLERRFSHRENRAHRGAVRSVAFNPKGDQVASAGADGLVKVWDIETGQLLCTQQGDGSDAVTVAFSPNGQKMVSGSANGSVNYWTVPLPPVPREDLGRIEAALPAQATVRPGKPRRVLVFWRADAILHKGGVPASNVAIEWMGRKTGAYEADFSRDYEALDSGVLAKYDAIVMNSTAHLVIPEGAKQPFLDYVKGGGGVVGIHAAIDMFKDWPEGAAIIGATFGGHPWHPSGTWAVKLEDPNHPLLRAWGGKNFKMHDEFYEMDEPYTRADRRVLLTVDMSDPVTAGVTGLRRPDRDFALSWIKRYGQGRVFYCDFGHIGEPFQDSRVLQYYLDGIQYALGDLEVDDSPKVDR